MHGERGFAAWRRVAVAALPSALYLSTIAFTPA